MQTQVSTWCKTKEELQNMANSLQKGGYETFFKSKKIRNKVCYSLFRKLTSQEKQDLDNGLLVLVKDFLSFKPSNKKSE